MRSASIARRWPTRVSQTVGAVAVVIARRLAEQRLDPLPARRPRSRRPGGARRARGSGRGRPRPVSRNASRTRRWNSSDSPSIRSRSANRPKPCSGSRSSTTVRCGRRSWVAQRATCSTSASVEGAAGALVGQRRVDVAVGDHDLAALERRHARRCRRARPCRRRRAAPRCGRTARRWPGRARSGASPCRPRCHRARRSAGRGSRRSLERRRRAPATGWTCPPPRRPRSRRRPRWWCARARPSPWSDRCSWPSVVEATHTPRRRRSRYGDAHDAPRLRRPRSSSAPTR